MSHLHMLYCGATALLGLRPPHYRGFTITLRHTTLGRTPLDEGSARRRDFYLTTHNTHNRQTSKPPVGFEPAIPAGERQQTHPLDRAATDSGTYRDYSWIKPLVFLPAVTALTAQRRRKTSNMSLFATYLQVNIDGRTSLSHYLNTDPLYPTANYWFNQTKTQITLFK
jgi:hypothetical protein